MHYNYLVIGGGIAGVTAAETIRAEDPKGAIGIIAFEPHLLYSRVLLPNFVEGHIRREQLFLRTIDSFEKKDIDIFLGKKVTFLNPEKREVKVESGEIYSFDKLLIASGGTPRPSGIPGENTPGIFRLQTLEDADALFSFLPNAKKATVVGGGFIALEFLEILRTHKIPAMLIVKGPRLFQDALDAAGGELVQRNLERAGITVMCDDEVAEFAGKERVTSLRTKKEIVVDTDLVGIGIGLKMNDDFILGTGIGVVPGQGARTDEFLETAVPGVFAAGDIASYYDARSGQYHSHGNWTNAFLQGRLAGHNMAGKDKLPFRAVPFYSINNLGLHITFLGDVGEGEEVEMVSRSDMGSRRYERFFLRNKRLAGAVLINMFQDKTILAELIEKGVALGSARDNLGDMAFDVKTLLG